MLIDLKNLIGLSIAAALTLGCGPVQKYPVSWPSTPHSIERSKAEFNLGDFENCGLDANNKLVHLSDILLRFRPEPQYAKDQTEFNKLFENLRSSEQVSLLKNNDNHIFVDFTKDAQVTHFAVNDGPNQIQLKNGHIFIETSRFISRELVTEKWRYSLDLYLLNEYLYVHVNERSLGLIVLFPYWGREATWCRFRQTKSPLPNQ